MNSVQPPRRPAADLAALAPGAARRLIREGAHRGHTSGLAMGYLQGNLAVLPGGLALDFAAFCQRNPKPCPLLAIGERGDPRLPTLGQDIDLRTDLPGYRVWRHGRLVEEVTDIAEFWRDDFVAFVIGCSFSFEAALVEEGLEVRHIGLGCNVPMYASNVPCVAAGPFGGGMVVSMRPFRAADAIRAVEITSRFPLAHGAPVHLGDPAEIGVADLGKPDFGDPVPVRPGELPVFWACGVTPQLAIMNAAPEIAVTHAPGRMLITDLPSKGGAAVLPAS